MADQIVSWGGFNSKGTSGMGVTGSLSLIGDLNFQPGASGATRYISMSASPTEAAGNNIVIKAGDATASGNGGSITLSEGLGSTGGGRGTINMGTSGYTTINLGGGVNINNGGPNTGTSLTVNGGSQLAMRFDWDNINLVTSAVSSGNRILRFTGASQYQVRGSGTTSSTTSLLVQNANASGSLSVLDDGSVGIGTASPFSSGLTVVNPAYNGYGRVYMNANNTLIISDNNTGGNITFGPSNRIFINTQQLAISNGYISIGNGIAITANSYPYGSTFTLNNYFANNVGASTGLTISSNYVRNGAGGPNTGTAVRITDTNINTSAGVTNAITMLTVDPSVNTTGGATTLRGIYYNPAMSSSVGLIQHTAIETTTGSIVFNGGNVGIGTSSPSASLHISGSSSSALLKIDSPAVNNILYVSGSGNVGVGTGTPAYKTQISLAGGSSTAISTIASTNYNLVVQNTTDLAGTYAGIGFMNPYDTQGYIGVSQVGTGYGAGGNMLFALRPSGGGTVMTEYMRLLNNGNLLLGTTTDSARLTVKGSGTTSSTAALAVLNASGTNSFSVKDGIEAYSANTGKFQAIIGNWTETTPYTPTIWRTGSLATVKDIIIGSDGTLNGSSNRLNFVNYYFNGGQGPVSNFSGYLRTSITTYKPGGTGQDSGRGILVLGVYDTDYDTTLLNSFDVVSVGKYATTISGSVTVSSILTLSPQTPLPSGVPTGSFAVSSSAPPKPYFYDGTTWNALY